MDNKERGGMVKTPFTMRLDENVLALAKRLAVVERRSVTALIEIAIIQYASSRGVKTPFIGKGSERK
jgi:predicted transcriptional regulator